MYDAVKITGGVPGPQMQKAPNGPLWVNARESRVRWRLGRRIEVGVALLVFAVTAITVAGGLRS
jgi:hypothetical protein